MRSILAMMFALILICVFSPAASAYYNPGTGRWLSRDPLGEPSGNFIRPVEDSSRFMQRDNTAKTLHANLTAFVGNEPAAHVDPFGLWQYNPGMGDFSGHIGPDTTGTTMPSITQASLFWLQFNPDKAKFRGDQECGACREIQFIQIYKTNIPAHFTTPFTWHVDADPGPYYPNQNIGNPLMGMPTIMHDVPNFPGGNIHGNLGFVYDLQAESCAVCSKGQARGDVYGCVRWFHSFNLAGGGVYRQIGSVGYGAYMPLPGPRIVFDSRMHGGVGQPSSDMRSLILQAPGWASLFTPE